MSIDAWTTLAVLGGVLLLAGLTSLAPDLLLLTAVCVLFLCRIISPHEAFSGFANEGVLTIAALFVVVAGLRETGAMITLIQRMMGGKPESISKARARLVFPTVLASGFLNNTPLVAMILPVLTDWARRMRQPASQLMIPLSYAAILGGMCTLIGTSSNLVVNGLLMKAGYSGMSLFELSPVGIPCAAVGTLFLLFFSGKILGSDQKKEDSILNAKEYTLEMVVEAGGNFVGKTIEEAGLRHLPGMYLTEIHREGKIIPVVGPDEELRALDQLVFVGTVQSVVDLQRMPGLVPATNQVFKLDVPRFERVFVEAVVSNTCRLLRKSIREGRFRSYYDAVVIAVARNGRRIQSRIGDIVLEPGDVLLIEALPAFLDRHRNSRDFFLVSRLDGLAPLRTGRSWVALGIFAAMLIAAATRAVSMLEAGSLAAGLMLVTRCCSQEIARRSIDYRLLLAISASIGIGHALQSSGAANSIAASLVGVGGSDPRMVLLMIYVVTVLMAEFVSHNASAVIVFPVAILAGKALGVSVMPFVMAVAIGASAGFAIPFSYQTHMMVYGPGGYRLKDFLRMGIPMGILVGAVAWLLIPVIWPF